MRLIAYRIEKDVRIEPAPTTRSWMDAWLGRHPYHCLPMTAVNSYGWQLLCSRTFEATWLGGQSKKSVAVTPMSLGHDRIGFSHFGGGILTFDPGCLLRTEHPTQLFVSGPLNCIKHGITPLSAIVETSWLSFTFTMNWRFTAPGIAVRFEEGEPFCHFFPIVPAMIDDVEPELRELASEPALLRRYHELRLSRQLANGLRLTADGVAETGEHSYEHHYHAGTSAHGEQIAPRPRARYTVRRFVGAEATEPRALDGAGPEGDVERGLAASIPPAATCPGEITKPRA